MIEATQPGAVDRERRPDLPARGCTVSETHVHKRPSDRFYVFGATNVHSLQGLPDPAVAFLDATTHRANAYESQGLSSTNSCAFRWSCIRSRRRTRISSDASARTRTRAERERCR